MCDLCVPSVCSKRCNDRLHTQRRAGGRAMCYYALAQGPVPVLAFTTVHEGTEMDVCMYVLWTVISIELHRAVQSCTSLAALVRANALLAAPPPP